MSQQSCIDGVCKKQISIARPVRPVRFPFYELFRTMEWWRCQGANVMRSELNALIGWKEFLGICLYPLGNRLLRRARILSSSWRWGVPGQFRPRLKVVRMPIRAALFLRPGSSCITLASYLAGQATLTDCHLEKKNEGDRPERALQVN